MTHVADVNTGDRTEKVCGFGVGRGNAAVVIELHVRGSMKPRLLHMEDNRPARLTAFGARRQVEGANLLGRATVGGDEEDSLGLVLEDQEAVKSQVVDDDAERQVPAGAFGCRTAPGRYSQLRSILTVRVIVWPGSIANSSGPWPDAFSGRGPPSAGPMVTRSFGAGARWIVPRLLTVCVTSRPRDARRRGDLARLGRGGRRRRRPGSASMTPSASSWPASIKSGVVTRNPGGTSAMSTRIGPSKPSIRSADTLNSLALPAPTLGLAPANVTLKSGRCWRIVSV